MKEERKLRQLVPGCQVDLVPFLAGESHVGSLAGVFDPLGVGGADDGLHAGGVAQDPGDGDGGVGHAVGCCDLIDLLVEFGELGVVEEHALEEAILERRPGLDRDVVQAAVIQDGAVADDGLVDFHIYIDAGVDHAGVGDAELELVEDELLLDELLEKLDLHGILVANAKVLDLATGFEDVKSFGNLLRFDEGVGAVKQEHVNVIGAQALEAAIHGFEDVLFGEVEAALADAAFGLEEHLFAQAGIHVERFGEFRFGLPAAVDIGVVKEVDAFVQGRVAEGGNL